MAGTPGTPDGAGTLSLKIVIIKNPFFPLLYTYGELGGFVNTLVIGDQEDIYYNGIINLSKGYVPIYMDIEHVPQPLGVNHSV
jgi:hypothetical protein